MRLVRLKHHSPATDLFLKFSSPTAGYPCHAYNVYPRIFDIQLLMSVWTNNTGHGDEATLLASKISFDSQQYRTPVLHGLAQYQERKKKDPTINSNSDALNHTGARSKRSPKQGTAKLDFERSNQKSRSWAIDSHDYPSSLSNRTAHRGTYFFR
jgi:hypothetical protein